MKKVSLFVLISLLAACSNNSETVTSVPEEGKATVKVMTVTVAAKKVDCVGMTPMRCLVVDGSLFYQHIKNFDFQEGYEYRLEIERAQRYLNSPAPADASVYEYNLLQVLSKKKVSP
ncbi:MAG: DUF4377 domain-containing protein [Colwellia sp.]